jgi:hypothetical protein
MDIAYSHILHHRILNEDNKKKQRKVSVGYNSFAKDEDISPIRSKACSKCGQSVYFCDCSLNLDSTNK